MNDDDRNLRDSFRSFDHSVAAPDHLRDKVYSAFDLDPAPRSRLRSTISGRGFRVISGLATAAVIVFLIGAGLVVYGNHPGKPGNDNTSYVLAAAGTPAADAQLPAMTNGSADQTSSYPGPAPAMGDYVRLWTSPADDSANFLTFFGDSLYAVGSAANLAAPVPLTAYDSTTGTIRWQRSVLAAPLTVFSSGVIALLPEESAGDLATDYRVALLNLASGETVWQSANTYPVVTDDPWLLVNEISGDAIILQVNPETIVVLDAATGVERWVYTSTGTSTVDCSQQRCASAPAIGGDRLYLTDYSTNKLIALDFNSGQTLWSVDLVSADALAASDGPEGVEPLVDAQIHATATGVLAEILLGPDGTLYTTYDGATGAQTWSRTAGGSGPGGILAFTPTSIFVDLAGDDLDAGEGIEQIDSATGAVINRFENISTEELGRAIYLPQANLLLAGTRMLSSDESLVQSIPVISHLFGKSKAKATLRLIDPETMEVVGTTTFTECFVDSSISQNGEFVCEDAHGSGFAVYGPKPLQ
jgi:outer membrane protein assembly factor BamB